MQWVLPVIASASFGCIVAEQYQKIMKLRQQKTIKSKFEKKWKELHINDSLTYNNNVVFHEIKDSKKITSLFDYFINRTVTSGEIGLHTALNFNNKIRSISNNIKSQNISDVDLVLFVNTVGGELSSVKMICDTMQIFKETHNGKCFVVVDNYAFSGGTMIALSADIIMMDDFARLSKIDPQLDGIAIRHYENIKIDDKQHDFSSRKMISIGIEGMSTVNNITKRYIKDKYSDEIYNDIIQQFMYSDNSHSHTFNKKDCQKMGLNIIDIPNGLTID
jgi:ClpP class serine protease